MDLKIPSNFNDFKQVKVKETNCILIYIEKKDTSPSPSMCNNKSLKPSDKSELGQLNQADEIMRSRTSSPQSTSQNTDVSNSSSTPAAVQEWLNMFKEWNLRTKMSALEQILELCEYSHIKHVHNYIEPKLQHDYISELPKEVILHMLTYVRPRDLYKLAQVSSYWHQIANDPILWKNICKRAHIRVETINAVVIKCCQYHMTMQQQQQKVR